MYKYSNYKQTKLNREYVFIKSVPGSVSRKGSVKISGHEFCSNYGLLYGKQNIHLYTTQQNNSANIHYIMRAPILSVQHMIANLTNML